MKKSLSNFFALVIVSLTLLSILPVYSVAEQSNPNLRKKGLKVLLATAKTPAEHRTIAAYYRQQAQTLASSAAEHSSMAGQFTRARAATDPKQGIALALRASHCSYFAKQYAAQAKEAATLAAAHEEMAAKAGQL